MNAVYHPLVQRDLDAIIRYYDDIDPSLSDQFWNEFTAIVAAASNNPGQFHFEKKGRRRANLNRFPYHIVFREMPGRIKVLIIKHHRRNPGLGSRRS